MSSTTNTEDEVADRRPETSEQDGTTGTNVMVDDIPVATHPDRNRETFPITVPGDMYTFRVSEAPDLRGV